MILHHVLTTEKVPFSYRVAGLGSRFLAWLVDLLVIGMLAVVGLMFALVFMAMGRPGLGQAVFQLWVFGLTWAYFLLFEWLWRGQTPGKRLLGLRVIHWRGAGIGFGQSAVRNLLRIADCLPAAYALGFTVAGCNRESRRLGDLAAGTLVVHIERRGPLLRARQDSPAAPLERSQAALLRQRLGQLSRDQKQTLLDLVLRRDQLRVQERARLFRAVSLYLQERVELTPQEHQSDEKFVLELTALLGEQ